MNKEKVKADVEQRNYCLRSFDQYKSDLFKRHIPEEACRLVRQKAEKYYRYEWPSLLATGYLRFSEDGNREEFENKYFEKRSALGWMVLSVYLSNDHKYIPAIINGIFSLCEESNWVVPAHNHHLAGCEDNILGDPEHIFVDLFAAETGALLSFTSFLLEEQLDEISPLIRKRIGYELKKRIINPYLKHDDFWWMGFVENTKNHHKINNWNPWCNMNCLTTFLLIEENEEKLKKGVQKCIDSFNIYLNGQPEDGGCDEGATYWGHAAGSVYILADLLLGYSQGEINYFEDSKVRNMGEYICKAHINDTYYLPFADCNVRNVNLPEEIIYRFGEALNHEGLKALAGEIGREKENKLDPEPHFPMYKILHKLFLYHKIQNNATSIIHEKDTWWNQIEVMCSRSDEYKKDGLLIAAKGNHNDESHNHNDVGNFVIYIDGEPMVVDVGVETYTKKTFGEDRYDIWTMQSGYHNLPTINGCQQAYGKQYKSKNVSYISDHESTIFSLDIDEAYPEQAGIIKWNRQFVYDRMNHEIRVKEKFDLREKTDKITMNYMTNCEPIKLKDNRIVLRNLVGKSVEISYPKGYFDFSVTEIPIKDERLLRSWKGSFYRIQLKLKKQVESEEWLFVIRQGV
ncbi:MAG: heparinase [Clostridia bacterium]|jgi:hypothetical protein|nr:heparinase [Clostridia bacterium]